MFKSLVAAALLFSTAASGQEVIKGTAFAIDGDTINMTPDGGGKDIRIRLWGIDAAEMKKLAVRTKARGALDLVIYGAQQRVSTARAGGSPRPCKGR